jgi:hypothetical protein
VRKCPACHASARAARLDGYGFGLGRASPDCAKVQHLPRQSDSCPYVRMWHRPRTRLRRLRKCNACHARATAAVMGGCGFGLRRPSPDCAKVPRLPRQGGGSASDAPPPTVRKCHACHATATAAILGGCGVGLRRHSPDCAKVPRLLRQGSPWHALQKILLERGGAIIFLVGPSRSADPQQKSRPKRILAFVDRNTADPNGGGFEKVCPRSLAKPILAVLTQTVAHQASLFDASFPQAPLSHATFSPISCF